MMPPWPGSARSTPGPLAREMEWGPYGSFRSGRPSDAHAQRGIHTAAGAAMSRRGAVVADRVVGAVHEDVAWAERHHRNPSLGIRISDERIGSQRDGGGGRGRRRA